MRNKQGKIEIHPETTVYLNETFSQRGQPGTQRSLNKFKTEESLSLHDPKTKRDEKMLSSVVSDRLDGSLGSSCDPEDDVLHQKRFQRKLRMLQAYLDFKFQDFKTY